MSDEWLARRLRVLDEPVAPDPDFAERLFETLASELGRADRTTPANSQGQQRSRRWTVGFLLAVLAIGVGMAGVIAVGGFLNAPRPSADLPHVCELITPAEIAAIVGAPVTLTTPESQTKSAGRESRSCGYSYPPVDPQDDARWFTLTLTRYDDPSLARASMQGGVAIPASSVGGDAAAYFLNPPRQQLLVLKAADLVAIDAPTLPGASGPITRGEMVDIARLVVSRL